MVNDGALEISLVLDKEGMDGMMAVVADVSARGRVGGIQCRFAYSQQQQ